MTSTCGASTIWSSATCGSSYRVWMPSRFMTAMPPRRSISAANEGEAMASTADARTGAGRSIPSTEKSMLVRSGLTVTSPGAIATSSNPYALRSSGTWPVAIWHPRWDIL